MDHNLNNHVYANPFFENGHFTANGIEWCQENRPLYEILGEKFFEHHKHSLESRVCASLYEDPLWNYDGPDRTQKLMEKSIYYSHLEISESKEESQTGIIDTTPASGRDKVSLQKITEDGQVTVKLSATKPIANTPMEIDMLFLDRGKSPISNIKYSLKAVQDGIPIILNDDGQSEDGVETILTRPLQSDSPVDIQITVKGTGLQHSENEQMTPNGETVTFTVVPEFGIFVMVVLAVSVMSVIATSRYAMRQP